MPQPPNKNLVGAGTPFSRTGPQLTTIPIKAPVFPRQGKSSVLGGITGASPTTPGRLDRATIPSLDTGTILLRVNLWNPVDVDRPSILFSTTPDDNGGGPVFFYNYGRPRTTPFGTNTQVSERGGVCHLSTAGRWWVYNFGGADPVDRLCVVIDAENEQILEKFTNRPGVNYVRESSVNLTDATIEYEIAVGGPSNWRSAMIFQNVPNAAGTSAPIRFAISQASGYLVTAGVWNGVGFRLQANGSMILSERSLARGKIFACLEAAGDATIEWAEFRDA